MPELSIIIAAADGKDYTAQCLGALLPQVAPDEAEVIVVDDASTDGTAELLANTPGIKVITRARRQGMAAAFNRGAREAAGKELLFLHNDTLLPPDTIVALRKVLASDEASGAVSPMAPSSRSIYTRIAVPPYHTRGELDAIARQVSTAGGHWSVHWALVLDDFCLLIRKDALIAVGGFDERFTPRYFAAEDLSVRLWLAGYTLLAAGHVLVHHGAQRANSSAIGSHLPVNQALFQKKWGFLPHYSLNVNDLLLSNIDWRQPSLTVLDVGCAGGGNLMRLKELRPDSGRYGIELNPGAARIASLFGEVSAQDVTKIDRPDWAGKFSYVLSGDLLEHLADPWETARLLGKLLKPGTGRLLISLPNVLHYTVWQELLAGKWTYQPQGVLDRTHLRFFTKESGLRFLTEAGFAARIVGRNEFYGADGGAMEPAIAHILKTPGTTLAREDFTTLQWIIEAQPVA